MYDSFFNENRIFCLWIQEFISLFFYFFQIILFLDLENYPAS